MADTRAGGVRTGRQHGYFFIYFILLHFEVLKGTLQNSKMVGTLV